MRDDVTLPRAQVCFVSATIYPVLCDIGIQFVGGAQVQQSIVARALVARGYRVSVLTADHGVADSVTSDGIEIRHTPPPGNRGIKGLRRIHPRMTDVVRCLREIGPDIVYFRGAGGVLAACSWYARRAGKKVVFAAASNADFHSGRIFDLEGREAFLYRCGLRWCDAVVVQNLEQQRVLRQRFGKTGVVIPNCYAENDFVGGSAGGPVIWVGTISPFKRPEQFLALAARRPDLRFILVGGPAGRHASAMDYYHFIETGARRLPNLQFAGYVPFDKVARYFDGASALVNTSETEGFPNTFLQAWIRGVPTLSFVAPTISAEPTGTIICHDLGDMDVKLAGLLQDSQRWLENSERVKRQFAAYHSLDIVMAMYESLLSALHTRASPAAAGGKS